MKIEKWIKQRRIDTTVLRYAKHLFSNRKVYVSAAICTVMLPAGVLAAKRQILQAQWQQLTQDKAFSYKNDLETLQPVRQYDPGTLQKIFAALFNFFGSGAGNILLWLIVICVVFYIIYRLFFSSDSFLFGRSKKILSEADKPQDDDEDLILTNWEALFQQAVNNSDTRMAVRYSYKWLLQMLQHKGLIQYRNDKTNYEYYTELNETVYKQSFKQLSRQYEYAWYGHFALPHTAYNDYMAMFQSTRKQLGA
jgi:hypothetical protein